jgi:hypothetical protein
MKAMKTSNIERRTLNAECYNGIRGVNAVADVSPLYLKVRASLRRLLQFN